MACLAGSHVFQVPYPRGGTFNSQIESPKGSSWLLTPASGSEGEWQQRGWSRPLLEVPQSFSWVSKMGVETTDPEGGVRERAAAWRNPNYPLHYLWRLCDSQLWGVGDGENA